MQEARTRKTQIRNTRKKLYFRGNTFLYIVSRVDVFTFKLSGAEKEIYVYEKNISIIVKVRLL